MDAWILSIVGVICLGVLLEIVLPDGQTTKYVKATFSLLVIFVMVAPLPKLLGGDWKLDLGDISFSVDEDFQDETVKLQEKQIAANVKKYLTANEFEVNVTITLKEKSMQDISRMKIELKLPPPEMENRQKHIAHVRELIENRYNLDDGVLEITAIKANT